MESTEQLKSQIEQSLETYFAETPYFLVEVQVTPTGRIMVFADGETNITVEKCVQISRFLENYLESNGLVGEKYTLEVSSPGMDEPLKIAQQYKKCIGREMEVLLKNGMKEIGTLLSFDETGFSIEIPEQKKKKEIVPAEQKTYTYEEVKHIKKHFVFK